MHLVTERNHKWWVVIAMAITTLLMTIDFNGLTVALPTIGRDLDTSTTGLQWTINAYLLALAAPSVAAGRLADIFGRRKVLLIGTLVFIAGSAASGLAQADWWLIAARRARLRRGRFLPPPSLSSVPLSRLRSGAKESACGPVSAPWDWL
jgi:predicted MFS family arabinose efflux permease